MPNKQIDDERERQVLIEWSGLTNEVQLLCVDLNDRTSSWQGMSTDPAAFSLILFKRAYGHVRAFSLLYNEKLYLDADACGRNAVEVAICLANLAARPGGFIADLRSDAASTAKGQMPNWGLDDPEFADQATGDLTRIFGDRRSDGSRHQKLNMSALADGAGLSHLYRWYRHFSGMRVHVTGLSILSNIVAVGDDDHETSVDAFRRLSRIHGLAAVGGASAISCEAHARLHRVDELRDRAAELMRRMSALGPTEIFGP
ncbi:DUF5677 domain-containing protein [Phenylobacterium kunshanense]|uniref:Uncharacterized protein n=1 Tax=Phenylobacterium kunshanense TaxID=1445034 RepID=A0A328BGE0_9CAUL|nr:DUF5677 domain-containing protein [Phenylobacterium kunshanense]RAK64966.1 hypothetical protein DJ019_13250 [Phenylobacterium kunshanense]